MQWVSWATKAFGYVGQFVLRPWLFNVDFLAHRGPCIRLSGDFSPYVTIGASIRVHNRKYRVRRALSLP
jgi:hypothetical protein